ncbi:CTP_transf_1 domain-containing protein [Cephalotus follicularis]|uniref:CTP_transf_1 domain-containing protein n=1 Tax=Cephalotus follicularis TaxID=3775 RepID=A0A1Q3BFA5_CEPFO|nr:CTP_transf_1 domain-containing protein [Cephalotus follicularis]
MNVTTRNEKLNPTCINKHHTLKKQIRKMSTTTKLTYIYTTKATSFKTTPLLGPNLSSTSSLLLLTNYSDDNIFAFGLKLRPTYPRRSRRNLTSAPGAMLLPQNPVLSDICATAVSGAVALSILRSFEEAAKRRLFEKKLNRKLVHISIGLAFMLCWPLFSSGQRGAIFASLTPGINIVRMLLLGLGLLKDEAAVKSISRYGDHRELLKGPLYYAATITFACVVYWRSSPIAISAICNLCAGDGLADVVGRRFGHQKLPYNRNKSIIGSVAMASAGFLSSLGFMYYLSSFGYLQKSWEMVLGFLVVSLASALVESLPISTVLDDNLTVTLTSILVGSLVF